jgi:hypothetical protein
MLAYEIGTDDRVRSVSDGWTAFARTNGAGQLTAEAVVGQPLLGFVSGPETRHMYEIILDRVRRTQRLMRIPYRCDSPSIRRFMELSITPAQDGGIRFESRTVREESRQALSILNAAAAPSEEFVVVCSWCKRFRALESWLEVEDAIRRGGLFEADRMPQLTHGMCSDCSAAVLREMDGTLGKESGPI